ncbi:hypothetical protein AVEN_59023-1 [Araneus ventricosus]|uniref:Uncharacterized protein n=1 Tax=Araneus ventricosus TaxID=182803 RepID=A0A4Y2TB92_ARAVE|nr:hypothetical protein AVEN_59021-1 [Araneus ventricosus]GBN97055.1 hypothetical protein AVEN_59023-1 [Araneus ventricosus]
MSFIRVVVHEIPYKTHPLPSINNEAFYLSSRFLLFCWERRPEVKKEAEQSLIPGNIVVHYSGLNLNDREITEVEGKGKDTWSATFAIDVLRAISFFAPLKCSCVAIGSEERD